MSRGEAPALVRAPIVEVVCGVRFRAIPSFDTLRHGVFWSRIRDRFPRSEVHPLLTDPGARIVSDVPLQRTWFVTGDDEFVIQVQMDRFYVNWRKRGRPYPRFADERDVGVFARFEREFEGFRVFLRDALDATPVVEGIELSKVDVLERPTDWTDEDDLGVMIPRLKSVVTGRSLERMSVNLAVVEAENGGALHRVFRSLTTPTGPRIHAEFRFAGGVQEGHDLSSVFSTANERLNAAFFDEFPDAERRFGTGLQ